MLPSPVECTFPHCLSSVVNFHISRRDLFATSGMASRLSRVALERASVRVMISVPTVHQTTYALLGMTESPVAKMRVQTMSTHWDPAREIVTIMMIVKKA